MYEDKMTRTVETWFVPPQDGDYVFHASCDDRCTVYLSTSNMDSSSASTIISSSSYNTWRNFWKPSDSISSEAQTLTAGNHYYLKVVHDSWYGGDKMTVGFTIKDTTTPHSNSQKGWKKLSIDPKHTFESFEFSLPNNTEANYKVQFKNSALSCTGVSTSSDVFQCTYLTCPCVSSSFKASDSVSTIRNALRTNFDNVHWRYAYYFEITKQQLDTNGAETTVAEDVDSYKITVTARNALPATHSSTDLKIYSDDSSLSLTNPTKTSESTLPLTGKFKFKIPHNSAGDTVTSDELILNGANGYYINSIYKAVPEYLGRVEVRSNTDNFLSHEEGKDFYYRISGTSYGDIELIDSSETPLSGGSETEATEFGSDGSYIVATNEPFYETIPGGMTRTVESTPQLVVTTNGLVGACPSSGSCAISFIDNVAQVTSRSNAADYSTLTFTGTSIPNSELTYVSVGTLRRCEIDSTTTPTATSVLCNIANPIAGSHSTVLQSAKGAIENASGVSSLEIPVKIDSASPMTLSSSGGNVLTITGDYFPQSLTEAKTFSDFAITFAGSSTCEAISVSQTTIMCKVPSGLTGTPKVTVTFNGKSTEFASTFTVNIVTATVTSIDKTSVSPVDKQDLVITVSEISSSTASDYTAILVSSEREIFMRVTSIDTSAKTLIARFPGAPKAEQFTVFIETSSERYVSSVILNTQAEITGLEITTTLPTAKTTIGTTGGDTIKFTGNGFSTTKDNNIVVIGNAKAEIVSSSVTELVVRAGATSTTGSGEITAFLKPNIEVSCGIGAGCTLTYAEDSTLSLTNSSSELEHTEGVITITGTGFGSNAIGYIGEYQQTTISSSPTEVQLKLTKMDNNEDFSLVVRTDDVNLPTVMVMKPFAAALLRVSPQIGSIGGQKITFSTVGLGLQTTSDLNIFSGSGSSTIDVCETGSITLVDSSTVTCVTKNNIAVAKTELKVSYTHRSTVNGETSSKILTCATSTNCKYETAATSTPTISSTSTSENVLTLEMDSTFSFDSTYTVKLHYGKSEVASTSISGQTITGTFSEGFAPGVASIRASFEKDGQITYSSPSTETINLTATLTGSSVSCSWAGGCNIELNQAGLKAGAESGDITVTVCGAEAIHQLGSSSSSQLILWAPSHATTHSLDSYKVEKAQIITGTVSSVPADLGALAFDGITSTQYKSAIDDCYVQVMFDSSKVGRLTKVRYFMNRMTDKQTNFVDKLKFQSSSDGSTWTDVFTADTYLREGWNNYEPTSAFNAQYFRFYSATKEACQIGEIEFWGNVVEDSSATSKTCDVVINGLGSDTQTISGGVTYSDSASSVVTSISPRYGTYKGGETVTFTGTGFSSAQSETTVTIDGVDCSVTQATSTQVQCTTGARPTINSNPSTVLSFSGSAQNGHASMQALMYKYANYWSDLETWSGEYTPQEGNSVLIPQGQTLVVDVNSTPILNAIIIQGAMIFAPDGDSKHLRTFDARYIYVDEGAIFEAGTEDNRYTSKLIITMHGTKEDAQIPVYGNKGIFVRKGQLDIHGVVRDYTWTELASTVEVGGDTITLNTKTDWEAGEMIVIAPTDFEVDHAEEFEIMDVDNSGAQTILTLDRPTTYKHYSGSKDYTGSNAVNSDKTKTLEMRAEVGLLTRNVVFKGADHDSVDNMYGAHIMLHSTGDDSLTGRISYTEFTQVGQAFQLGRYPIHFHMIGSVHNSYIKGNAIHHTYNRACTIHGVHYLTIEDNVAYETMGHTFFIEDGAETKNLLKNNLAVKTKRSWALLNTDQTPASFWITHPDNQFIGNHAAGSDRYGFWFDLQEHPTGPSFDPNVCPEFEQLGEFTGNVAHSNGRYGLRIFHRFTPVTNPCAALATGAHNSREQADPTVSVPIDTHFRDFLGYKNKRTGIIADELGALKFHNIRVADNILSGVEFGITQAGPWLTSTDDYHLQDALIVGASDNSEEAQVTDEEASTTRGIKGANTEKMRIKDTIFANFNHDNRWGAIGTCSHCEGPATDSSGRTYFTKNLYFTDSTQRVKFDTPFKEIIYDEDGTLGSSTHRWIVHYYEHLDVPECTRNEAVYNGLLCNNDIVIRRIVMHNPKPYDSLKYLPMKIMNTNVVASSRRMLSVSPVECPTASSSVIDLATVDSGALALQESLLTAYDQMAKNKTAYTTSTELYDSTGAQEHLDTALTSQTNMEAIQAEIDTLEPLVEAEKGKYDELYKTDKNFCNVNNYSKTDFRVKNNPAKNWVFNVISGYEYKLHASQGVDIDSMDTEYSYKELIENDGTKGVVLHFNHTERTEAFKVTYKDSTTKLSTEVTKQTAPFTVADTSIKMGDFHLNNVTRHMMLKFDGQEADRNEFVLTRHECITVGGCSGELPNEGEIETTPRYWSDPNSWTSGALPVEGDEVVIESTWNMILDVNDLPVLKTLEVNGRLTVENDGGSYSIEAFMIYVRRGELIVGTEEEPFIGTVTFTLHGTRSDKDTYFHDKMFEGGNKVIANTGKLRMYGKTVGLKWTRLAAKALAGATTIELLDTPTDWAEGDNIGIAPSGRDYTQRDFATIQSISGKVVTLRSALVYEHFGATAIDSSKTGAIDIRAEVVHLSRNIKVQGTDEDMWGGHIVSAHNNDSGFVNGQLITIERKGSMILDHVEFVNCSQFDTDKAAIRFANYFALTDEDTKSSVSNSAVYNGLGIGILVTEADDVKVENNVVFFQHIGGIWMKKSHNTEILGNVVAGMGTRYWSGETNLDEIAAFNFCNHYQKCRNLQVKNNVAAGGERLGFFIPTVGCTDAEKANYENNLAHSFEYGAWIATNGLISSSDSQCFTSFKVYKTMMQGVFSLQQFNSLKVSNIETLDCSRGIGLMNGGSNDNNFIEISDSTIWGESEDLPQDSGSFCISIYGMHLSNSPQDLKNFPEKEIISLPYENIMGEGNWNTVATNINVHFKNWKSATRQHCSSASTKSQKALFINPFNADHVPVNTFTGTKFVNVANDAVAYLEDPKPWWAKIND